MKEINLESVLGKRVYSFNEFRNAFKVGTDIRYAIDNSLFDFFYEGVFADGYIVQFIDGEERRLSGVWDENPYPLYHSYNTNFLVPGEVVYRSRDKEDYVMSPAVYQYHNWFNVVRDSHLLDKELDNIELATIATIRCRLLSPKEKKAVKKLLDDATSHGRNYYNLHSYVQYMKAKIRKRELEKVIKVKAKARAQEREQKRMEKLAVKRGDKRFEKALRNYRTYQHIDDCVVELNSKENGIKVELRVDRNGYSSQTRYSMMCYTYHLHIRRGYHFGCWGGLLTLYYGKYNRLGMACEWIEQKRYEFYTVKGYLVRGEHIVAKSLSEAIAINKEHRQKMLPDAVNQLQQERKRRAEWQERHQRALEEAEPYLNETITFDDSLQSGNCRPGTQNFKDNVESALGREVQTLTVREIIPLAIKFRQQYYVQRIFNHKGYKVNIGDFA